MIYIITASIFYAIALIFATIASRNINTNLSSAIGNLLSAIIPIVIAIPLLNKNLLNNPQSKLGISMAVLAGIAVAFFTLALTKSFSVNKVAIVAPLVFGGSIFLSAILSTIFLKEKITLVEGLGLLVLGVGLIIIIYARLSGK